MSFTGYELFSDIRDRPELLSDEFLIKDLVGLDVLKNNIDKNGKK
jgi:ribosomal 30S subunit maturation factor RimM